MITYMPREVAIDQHRKLARRALRTARYWLTESRIPAGTSFAPNAALRRQMRADAAYFLTEAGRERQLLAVELSYRAVAWTDALGPRFGSVTT